MDKTKRVSLPTRVFNVLERRAIIQDYLTGTLSKREVWKKYTGQQEEKGQMLRWMRQLGYLSKEKRSIHIPLPTKSNQNNPQSSASPEDLQKRIKELELQLAEAQLKAEGYQMMIEIAEKELKIPIRKKLNTK